MALLPSGPMPPPQDPFASASFSQEVQKALMVAFMQLQHSFAVKGKSAGSTATVVLQVFLIQMNRTFSRLFMKTVHAFHFWFCHLVW